MTDHGIADLDRCHARTDFLNPPGIFVAENVGEQGALWVLNVFPHPFNDVQIGAAQTGSANPDNYFTGFGDFGQRDILKLKLDVQMLIVLV